MSGYLTGYNWSQEEHDILVEMLDNGMNIREIENSGKLNRKYQNIWQYAKRHGLETNLSNRFCGMCDNSISDRPSQALYCVECTLKRDWLKKKQEHNIQSRDNLWSVEEIEKMVYLNNKGLPDNEISSLVGRTKRAIEHKRAQLGIKSKYQIKPYKLTPEKVDEVILIYVPCRVQLKRLMLRDNLSKEDAMNRIKSQMKIDEKINYSTYVINNEGDFDSLYEQIDKLVRGLKDEGKQ